MKFPSVNVIGIDKFLNKLYTNETSEEMKNDLIKEINKYPLICEILNKNLTENQKKEKLQKALKKQEEASENMDTERLNVIAQTMGEQILKTIKTNQKFLDFLNSLNSRNPNEPLPKEEKEEIEGIFQTIIQNFSEAFGIKPPKLYVDWLNISWLGTSTFIKIDWEMALWQLMHEYTHYLQTQWKTSNPKYLEQSRRYYILPMFNGELWELTNNIYNISLMEQEAEYTRKKAQKYMKTHR